MNRFFYFFTIIFSSIILFSCSSDDNSPIVEEPSIIGNWSIYAMDLKVELDGEIFLDFEDSEEEGLEYHFKDNGMVDVFIFDFDTGEEEKHTVSYQIKDDILIMDDKDYTILLFDNHFLHINLYYEGYNNTMNAYEKVSITQKLEKI